MRSSRPCTALHACSLALTVLVLLALSKPGVADCRKEWLCIDEVRRGNDVELRARNLRNYPVTYTLRVRPKNFDIRGPTTVTRTLGPGATEQAMFLDHREGGDKGTYRYNFRFAVGRIDADHDDDHLYALPYRSERSYRVLQGYGSRFSHTGREEFSVDFSMRIGTPVHAARSGVVARIEESHSIGCWDDECSQYANFIVILHPDGTTGEYYHLKKNGVLVRVGDSVARGQKIGLSGNTGHTTMPHLHFGVYRPIEWGRTQSIAVRFQGADGIIERPRRGARYQAQ